MNVLVTGANRGIGYEFARQCAERGDSVFATCRKPDEVKDLGQLASKHAGRLRVVAMDVSDPASITACFHSVSRETKELDLLINNAGVYSSRGSASPRE